MNTRQRFLAKRLGLSAIALYFVATILFLMFRLLPGDPTTAMIAPQMSASAREEMAAQFGLDAPLYIQYLAYLQNLLVGNLGISFRFNEPVAQILVTRMMNTLVLMLTAVVLAYATGIFIGSLFAWKRGSKLDSYGTGVVLLMYAAPVFWTGMIGLMVFSYQLSWVPSGGIRDAGFIPGSIFANYIAVDFLKHLVLPLTVTTLYFLAVPALTMRNNMIDVLGADFIELNRAQGLSEYAILYRHAARNALLPVLHYAAVSIGFAFGGSVIIETVFSWPGIGRLMWEATLSQDYPVAQGAFLLLATVVITMNFLADALSVYVDPRAAEGEQ